MIAAGRVTAVSSTPATTTRANPANVKGACPCHQGVKSGSLEVRSALRAAYEKLTRNQLSPTNFAQVQSESSGKPRRAPKPIAAITGGISDAQRAAWARVVSS